MRQLNFPIRITVTSSFILFTVLAVSIVAVLNYMESRHTILEVAKVRMGHSAELAQNEVDKLIESTYATANSIAILPKSIFNEDYPDTLESVLVAALKNSPEMYGIFVGFPNGTFIQAIKFFDPDGSARKVPGVPENAATGWRIIQQDKALKIRTEYWRFFDIFGDEIYDKEKNTKVPAEYDPRKRSWYIEAQNTGKASITKAYVFASLRKPGVTVSAPIQEYKGATIGIDLPLTSLSQLAKRVSPGKNGIVAIYDADGQMIAYPTHNEIVEFHTESGELRLASAENINDPRLRSAREIFNKNQTPQIEFSAMGNDYIAYFNKLKADSKTNWQIVSIAAINDFTGNLVDTLYYSLLIAGTVLVFAVWGVAALAGWIAIPIIRLRAMSDRITNLNLAPTESFNTPFDEIHSLTNSMERMRSALETFIRYVPRELVRELIQSGEKIEVGGVKREVTLLFTDIEGFTSLTEKMSPEQVMSQTSEYFERMAFAIQANRGTIDKFIGDAVMAVWNAPTFDEDHVNNACRGTLTALAMSEDLNTELAERGQDAMRTRFGLHTGEALVGNMGAHDRLQYTCLGACVNLASRIEGLNKYYGTNILVSDAFRRKASRNFVFRRVDIVEAKGTSVPLVLYELMGEQGEFSAFELSKEEIKRASDYEQAFDFYLHKDFEQAEIILNKLKAEAPEDRVVQSLLDRIQGYIKTPPPADWNGVTSFDKK